MILDGDTTLCVSPVTGERSFPWFFLKPRGFKRLTFFWRSLYQTVYTMSGYSGRAPLLASSFSRSAPFCPRKIQNLYRESFFPN